MNSIDSIILVAYLLAIAYFIANIINAFNDEFTIRLDEEGLRQQLTDQGLQDLIAISFKFEKRIEFDKFKQLAISISNKSSRQGENPPITINVDWDSSILTDLEGRSRRVTRLLPGSTLDLFQDQVLSTIAPGTTLKENITAEDTLQRKGERKADKLDTAAPQNLEIEVSKPLIDLTKLDPKKKPEHAKFLKQQVDLEFSLELALRLLGPDRAYAGDRIRILCKFILHKLPWAAGLPWNPK